LCGSGALAQIKASSLPFFEISSPQEYPLPLSSRLGIFNHIDSLRLIAFNSTGFDTDGTFLDKTSVDTLSQPAPSDSCGIAFSRGGKRYELSNHLGNVLAVISDRKLQVLDGGMSLGHYFRADIWSARDYYPFGMGMGGRAWTQNSDYRFGFNGMEGDDEIKGKGNSYNFGARIYDPRIGRWLATDRLESKYPGTAPYTFALNSPLILIDPDGNEVVIKRIPGGGKNGKDKVIISITAKIVDKTSKLSQIQILKDKIDNINPKRKKRINSAQAELAALESEYQNFRQNEVARITGELKETYSGEGEEIDWEMGIIDIQFQADETQLSADDHIFYAVDNVSGATAQVNEIGGKVLYYAPFENALKQDETYEIRPHEFGHFLGLLHPESNQYKYNDLGSKELNVLFKGDLAKITEVYISFFGKENVMFGGGYFRKGLAGGDQTIEDQILWAEDFFNRGMLNRGRNDFESDHGEKTPNNSEDFKKELEVSDYKE
jgi:RHS repeat-associated protein